MKILSAALNKKSIKTLEIAPERGQSAGTKRMKRSSLEGGQRAVFLSTRCFCWGRVIKGSRGATV